MITSSREQKNSQQHWFETRTAKAPLALRWGCVPCVTLRAKVNTPGLCILVLSANTVSQKDGAPTRSGCRDRGQNVYTFSRQFDPKWSHFQLNPLLNIWKSEPRIWNSIWKSEGGSPPSALGRCHVTDTSLTRHEVQPFLKIDFHICSISRI